MCFWFIYTVCICLCSAYVLLIDVFVLKFEMLAWLGCFTEQVIHTAVTVFVDQQAQSPRAWFLSNCCKSYKSYSGIIVLTGSLFGHHTSRKSSSVFLKLSERKSWRSEKLMNRSKQWRSAKDPSSVCILMIPTTSSSLHQLLEFLLAVQLELKVLAALRNCYRSIWNSISLYAPFLSVLFHNMSSKNWCIFNSNIHWMLSQIIIDSHNSWSNLWLQYCIRIQTLDVYRTVAEQGPKSFITNNPTVAWL